MKRGILLLWLIVVVFCVAACAPAFAASFDKSIPVVFKHEGGYVNDPHDPGGETKYGISKRSYPKVDIKRLTKTEAARLYCRDYWSSIQGGRIKSQALATLILDGAVLGGTSSEIRIVQTALNMTNFPKRDVRVTGVMDDMTINMLNSRRTRKQREVLFKTICGLQFERYHKIVIVRPDSERYVTSWLARLGDIETLDSRPKVKKA